MMKVVAGQEADPGRVAALENELFCLIEAGGASDWALRTHAPTLISLSVVEDGVETTIYERARAAISAALSRLEAKAAERVILGRRSRGQPSTTRSWGVPQAAIVLSVLLNAHASPSGSLRLGSQDDHALYKEASERAGGSPSVRTIQREESRRAMARHAADEILRLEAEHSNKVRHLQRSVTELSLARLHELTATQFREQMKLFIGDPRAENRISDRKYIPEVYVERANLRAIFDEFRVRPDQAVAVVGDAGLGKTNELCREATRLAESFPVLFYRGSILGPSLRERILADLGQSEISFKAMVRLVDRATVPAAEYLFVFIDAINEASLSRDYLRADIDTFIEETRGSRVKLVVSCRTLDWSYWLRDSGGLPSALGRSCRWVSGKQQELDGAVSVGILSDAEFSRAWAKYRSYFGLVGEPSKGMRQLCREPFMLRLVAEVYRDRKEIPDYIHPFRLFDRYLQEKFSPPSAFIEYYRFLHWLGRKMVETERPWVAIADMGPQDTAVCRILVDEHVIIFERSDRVHFHFELFMEFIVARELIAQLPDPQSSADRLGVVEMLTGSSFINAPGVVENLLLYWQNDAAFFARALEILVTRTNRDPNKRESDKWRAIACSVLRKADVAPSTLEAAVRLLVRDPNYVIRLFISEALGADGSTCQPGGVAFTLAEDRDSWEARETAANVLAVSRKTDTSILELAWTLADDYHWRVRRAAGYALHDLWEAGATSASHRHDILRRPQDASWRQKYSLCVALHGADLDREQDALTALELYTQAENPQVRWAVANYLDRYLYSTSRVLEEVLLRDTDPWVKSRAVHALAARARRSLVDVSGALGSLADDPSSAVRLAVARELRLVRGASWIEPVLNRLADDTLPVAFAAAYTMHTLGLRRLEPSHFSNGQLLALREQVARCEMDIGLDRFAPIERYIFRRTEFVPRADSFMRIIDSMRTIIAASAEIVGQDSQWRRFVELLLVDEDESVRWALAWFLVESLSVAVDRTLALDLLQQLANDPHWWVRREVASSMRAFAGGSDAHTADAIVRDIVARERAAPGPCSDEVLIFAEASLALLANS